MEASEEVSSLIGPLFYFFAALLFGADCTTMTWTKFSNWAEKFVVFVAADVCVREREREIERDREKQRENVNENERRMK